LRTISTEEFDKLFDAGEDISEFVDWSKGRRPGLEQKRVNVDFPVWMIEALDRESTRIGVPRQSLIKMLIARHLDEADSTTSAPPADA